MRKDKIVLLMLVVAISIIGVLSLQDVHGAPINDLASYWKDAYYDLKAEYNKIWTLYYDALDRVRALELAADGSDYQRSTEYELQLDDYPPITIIENGYIVWDFADSKGNIYVWEMPIETYEDLVVSSDTKWESDEHTTTFRYSDGHTAKHRLYDWIVEESFSGVIDEVHQNSNGNSDFIWEVWFIVSQLTVYQEDVGVWSYGRHALETFTRQGGDCEDLAILVADMLRSSSHTSNWSIQLVHIDSKNPTNPQQVDHVIVRVHDGQYRYYIEATASQPSWNYYPEGVSGWFYDV